MEPSVVQTLLLNVGLIYGIPFLAFTFGVFLSDRLALHKIESRSNLYLMAIPVALITIGLMVSSTKIDRAAGNAIISEYGHMSAIDQYLIFNGIIIFYGTLVPQLFVDIRKKLIAKHKPAKDGAEKEA